MSDKVAVITGASSGFGLLTAVEMAAAGYRVVATMRNLDRRPLLDEALRALDLQLNPQLRTPEGKAILDAFHTPGKADPERRKQFEERARERYPSFNVDVRPLDITDADAIQPTIDKIVADYGRIDVLLNNAGFAMAGFLEDVTLDELRKQFETNFFGHVAVTRAVLPVMRRQRSGHIVMVTSIGGRAAAPVIGSYVASKFALEGWSESLRIEMQPVGVQIVLVEPGAYATDIWQRNATIGTLAMDPSSPNSARARRFSEHVAKSVHRADARDVARLILRIANNPHPRLRYVAGTDAKIQLFLKAMLPWRSYEKMIAKMLKIDRLD